MTEPLHFRRRHRLSRDREYQGVFADRVRTTRGPITVYARPNGLPHARLGLSIGRRAGPAVVRNAIKRRVREAFRVIRPNMPAGFDLIVTVRAHNPASVGRYQNWLGSAWDWLAASWRSKRDRSAGGALPGSTTGQGIE
ncbi:MAG: ribonuclease P protein component [Phycisphaerales bacterium]